MLRIEKLTKRYGTREILSEISLEIPLDGGIYGVFGPNGAGKTTLFRCIMGLVSFQSGRIEFANTDTSKQSTEEIVRRGIAYMFQEPILFHDLSVSENLAIVAEQLFRKAQMPDIDAILERYGLLGIKNNRASTVSGGEKKRLEFARCMLLNPRLFLLDEPFSNIDPIMIGEMKTLIGEHTKKGITFLITDHNLHETLPFVEYAFVLYGGGLIAEGKMEDVVSNPTVRGLYLGEYSRA